MNLENIVFIIIGANKGIGAALAKILISYNATVIGTYNQNKCQSDKIDFYKCDISKEDEVRDFFELIKAKYNHINVLVNCAASYDDAFFLEKNPDSFLDVLKTNVIGTFLLCKYATLFLEPRGVIVNLSSLDASETYNEYNMDYAASKAALENLTKNFAKNVSQLKFVALAPAWVDTESTLAMDPKYLKKELLKNNQESLLKKENVALKIIEMIVDDNIASGEIIIMK